MQKLNLNSNSNDEYLNELRKNKDLFGIDVNINNCNLLSRYLSNLFANSGIDSLLIYFPDLIRELKSLLNKADEFEDRINMLKSVDVLMLDDIGAELPSAWVRDEILCPILNYRAQEGLPVFFSTNYTIEGLRDFYIRPDGSINSADRLMSRIKSLATFVELK